MISDIRKTLKSTPVKIMIWLSLASIVGGGGIAFLYHLLIGGRPDIIATVNGHDITYLEFSRKVNEIQNFVQQIKQTQGVDADEVLKMWGLDKRPHEFVLEGLVGEKVMKSVGRNLGAHVHPEYMQAKLTDPYFVYQHLKDIVPPEAMRGGTINVRALQTNLERQGISESEFEELLHDALLRTLLFNLIEVGLYLPDEVLKDAYISYEVKKKYAYLPLARSQYVKKAREVQLPEADIQGYYSIKANQENYRISEKRSAKIWTFTPDAFGLTISEEDSKMAYNRSKSSYIKKPEEAKVQHILFPFTEENKTDVRAKAQEVYNELKAQPEKFAQVASEKSASSDKGSTITIKRSDKNQTFTSIAFGLKKDDISPVRETSEGFEIIKLVEKVQPEYKPFDEVKGEVTAKLKSEKFDRVFSSNAQRVVSQARQEPALLTKFIEQHKGQLSSVKEVTLSDSLQSKRIFKLRKSDDHGFYQDGGKGYIVELAEIIPSKVPALADIKQKVTEDIYQKKAEELLAEDLEQALSDIRSGKKTLAQVAQSLNGTVDITDWIKYSDRESLKKFEDMKLSLPEIAQLTKQGDLISDLTETHGYIVQVKQLAEIKPEEYEKEKTRIRAELTKQQNQGLTAGFIQSLKDKATISFNEQLLKQIR